MGNLRAVTVISLIGFYIPKITNITMVLWNSKVFCWGCSTQKSTYFSSFKFYNCTCLAKPDTKKKNDRLKLILKVKVTVLFAFNSIN